MFARDEPDMVYPNNSMLMTIVTSVTIHLTNPHLKLMRVAAFGIAVSLNFSLVPFAVLIQKCLKISKLVYSIIARCERCKRNLPYGSKVISTLTSVLWR